MSIEELEMTVSKLPPDELSRFREWFVAFDSQNWDRQFESDIAKGHIDVIADDAIREHRDGKSTPL